MSSSTFLAGASYGINAGDSASPAAGSDASTASRTADAVMPWSASARMAGLSGALSMPSSRWPEEMW